MSLFSSRNAVDVPERRRASNSGLDRLGWEAVKTKHSSMRDAMDLLDVD